MDTTIYQRPAEILQHLIRFDTTNPPGNEGECIGWVERLFRDSGFKTQILAKTSDRPNLIVRLPGEGKAPPLLVYGHVDVVTTEGQDWEHPPFGGDIVDNFIWGRGALDMKGGVAMMISGLLKLKSEGITPPGDIILAIVCDEENAGLFGSRFLVEEHPEQFENVRYAIGEFGGFNLEISGKKFYAIQIAEKQICWIRAKIHGQAGHGSMVNQGGAMAKLAELLKSLDENLLPVHVVPGVREMFIVMANGLSFPANFLIRQMLNPGLTDLVLKILGENGNLFKPLLRNTVNATIVHGGNKINVLPSEIILDLDGRLLPGFAPEDLLVEINQLLKMDVEFEVVFHDPGPSDPDMGLYDTLGDILKNLDPEGIPFPLVLQGVTDGRFFSQLGIQTYGFTPMQLPPDMNFSKTIHAANERIPVAAVEFGAEAMFQAMQQFHA